MPKGSLLLHPVNPDYQVDTVTLINSLSTTGLVGEVIAKLDWKAGENFLQLLTFMGCSPHIRFEPLSAHDQDYCHVSLQLHEQPVLAFSANSRPPRCRSCGKPVVAAWNDFEVSGHSWRCNHCEMLHSSVMQLRWRNDAGFARNFIEIHGIFPGEAQPVPSFMKQLETETATPWRYFYLHTS